MDIITFEHLKTYLFTSFDLIEIETYGSANPEEAEIANRKNVIDKRNFLLSFLTIITLKFLKENSNHPYNTIDLELEIAFKLFLVEILQFEDRNPSLKGVFNSLESFYIYTPKIDRILDHLSRISFNLMYMEDSNPRYGTFASAIEYLFEEKVSRISKYPLLPPTDTGELFSLLFTPVSGNLFDGGLGFGSLLIPSLKTLDDEQLNNTKIYCADNNRVSRSLCKYYLILHGLFNANVIMFPYVYNNGDALSNNVSFNFIFMDLVLSKRTIQQCFSLNNGGNKEPEKELRQQQYVNQSIDDKDFINWISDSTLILNILNWLSPHGKAAIVVPYSTLISGRENQRLRRRLIKEDLVETIIKLPKHFYPDQIDSAAIIILSNQKPSNQKNQIQLIEASNLLENDQHSLMEHLVQIYREYSFTPNISHLVTTLNIEQNDFHLNFTRYFSNEEIHTKIGVAKINLSAFEDPSIKKKTIDQVAEIFNGLTCKPITSDVYLGPKLLQISDLFEDHIQFSSLKYVSPKDAKKVTKYKLHPGDILLANRTNNVKLFVVPQLNEVIVASNNFIIIRLID